MLVNTDCDETWLPKTIDILLILNAMYDNQLKPYGAARDNACRYAVNPRADATEGNERRYAETGRADTTEPDQCTHAGHTRTMQQKARNADAQAV